MTPALTDTATQEPGVRFSPSLGIKSLNADLNVYVDHSKTNSKGIDSSLAYCESALCLQEDFAGLQQGGSLSSGHYQTVFVLTSSDMIVQDNSSFPSKTEQDAYGQRFLVQHDARPLLTERKVKRELFPGTVSKVLADVNKLWDISVMEDEGVHRLNGRIDGESLAIPFLTNSALPDFRCISPTREKLQKAVDKEREAKLLHLKCLNRQQELIGRAQRARKRLQVLLAKYAVDHCSQQIGGLVKRSIEKFSVPGSSAGESGPGVHSDPGPGVHSDPGPGVHSDLGPGVHSDLGPGVHSDPDPVARWTQSACVDYKHGASWVSPTAARRFSVPTTRIIGSIQQALDSDVTESSSDEDWEEKPKFTQDCNAEWNWLSGRADVGSRWTWLQSQIAELEYKIHQLVVLHSQLRSKKGTLVFQECSNCILGEETHLPYPGTSLQPAETLETPSEETNLPPVMDLEMSPSSPTLLLRNIEKQSAQLTEMVSSLIAAIPMTLSPTSPVKPFANGKMTAKGPPGTSKLQKAGAPTRNGFCKQQPVKRRKRIRVRASSNFGSSSARTRPLLLFHKRNLYRMFPDHTPLHLTLHFHQALHGSNESWQTSDYSSTWIRCDKPQKSVLVNRDVCEIEPNFHPILSLPADLPLHLHLEGLLTCKTDIRDSLNRRSFNSDDDENLSHVPARWSKSCTSSPGPQLVLETHNKERHCGGMAEDDAHPSHDHAVTPTSHKTSVQLEARDPGIVLSAARRRFRSESSYDIDNIVIPMNLVAPSKLEKLQYKEILTPSWKEVALEPLTCPPCEEIEDLSDEAFLIRHQKYERAERAHWSFWEQSKWPKRSRSSSHSSGQCTEDNWSPNSTSPDSWDTPPPGGCPFQALRSSADFQQGKAQHWERRIFPLTGEAAVALKDTQTTTKHLSRPPAQEDKGAICLHSSCDKENR